MAKVASDAANTHYQPILTVKLSDIEFPIFGSMSWTVNQTKKRPWEEVRRAYVGITGDNRDEVGHDAAANVVAGELQIAWAKFTGRDDILPTIEQNQLTRIELAMKSTDKSEPKRIMRTAKPQDTTTARKEGNMSETETATESTTAPAAEGTVPEGTKEKTKRTSIPTRGSMGAASKAMDEGLRDIDEIDKRVLAEFPNIKNAKRHIRYVAGLKGITLTKGGAAVAAEPDDAQAPAEDAGTSAPTSSPVEAAGATTGEAAPVPASAS